MYFSFCLGIHQGRLSLQAHQEGSAAEDVFPCKIQLGVCYLFCSLFCLTLDPANQKPIKVFRHAALHKQRSDGNKSVQSSWTAISVWHDCEYMHKTKALNLVPAYKMGNRQIYFYNDVNFSPILTYKNSKMKSLKDQCAIFFRGSIHRNAI